MKAKVLIVLLIGVITIYACKKTSTTDRPTLTFKNVNDTVFSQNKQIIFDFDFTHKTTQEITDTLVIKEVFFNCNPVTDSFPLPVYTVVANQKNALEYKYTYGSGGVYNGCLNSNGNPVTDSVYYYFWLKDKYGNVSDTVRSPKIILLSQ